MAYFSITSTQNLKLKELILLRRSKSNSTFLVEGLKEIRAALAGGYSPQSLWFSTECHDAEVLEFLKSVRVQVFELSPACFSKVVVRDSPQIVLGVFERQSKWKLQDLASKDTLLWCDGIEKPGNLGAMLRTADACQVGGVVLTPPNPDPFSANAIRASLGMVFSVPHVICSHEELKEFLKAHPRPVYGAALTPESQAYTKFQYKTPKILAVGSEDKGISRSALQLVTHQIFIPMEGQADSLNVSVAAAVLLFEMRRQQKGLGSLQD